MLCLENEELDGVTDDTILHVHERFGHGKHFGNISCQPRRGEERRGEDLMAYFNLLNIHNQESKLEEYVQVHGHLGASPGATITKAKHSKRSFISFTIPKLVVVS